MIQAILKRVCFYLNMVVVTIKHLAHTIKNGHVITRVAFKA